MFAICAAIRSSYVCRENRVAKTNWYKISNFLRRAPKRQRKRNACNAASVYYVWRTYYAEYLSTPHRITCIVYVAQCMLYVICANIHHVSSVRASAYVALVCITLNGPEAVCKFVHRTHCLGAPPELAGDERCCRRRRQCSLNLRVSEMHTHSPTKKTKYIWWVMWELLWDYRVKSGRTNYSRMANRPKPFGNDCTTKTTQTPKNHN